MQLMPSTALWEYQKSGLDAPMHQLSENLRSQPELNIALGVQHIERLQNKLEGIKDSENLRMLVIASYNAGVHRVKRAFKCKGFDCYKYKANHYGKNYFKKSIRSLPAETRHYLRTVETYYQQFKEALSDKPIIAASLTT